MNQHNQFIEAVQAELDAGRDPLDYPEIVAWLEEHPEALEDFVNLRAVGLRLAAHQPKRKPWKTLGAIATAAGLLITVYTHPPGFFRSTIATPEGPHASLEVPLQNQRASQPPSPAPTPAVLLSVDVSQQRSFTVSHFAPADPETGAVVLTMTSSVQHTQL